MEHIAAFQTQNFYSALQSVELGPAFINTTGSRTPNLWDDTLIWQDAETWEDFQPE